MQRSRSSAPRSRRSERGDRKSTRLNSSHANISYAVFCLKKKIKNGVEVINVADGNLDVDDDLKHALDSGKVGGAALDVFRDEPVTEHPLFGSPHVVVTPHLGASTTEAQDRAGAQVAEQIVAALTGGGCTQHGNTQTMRTEVVGSRRPVRS